MSVGDVLDRVALAPLLVICGVWLVIWLLAGAYLIWTDPHRERK